MRTRRRNENKDELHTRLIRKRRANKTIFLFLNGEKEQLMLFLFLFLNIFHYSFHLLGPVALRAFSQISSSSWWWVAVGCVKAALSASQVMLPDLSVGWRHFCAYLGKFKLKLSLGKHIFWFDRLYFIYTYFLYKMGKNQSITP